MLALLYLAAAVLAGDALARRWFSFVSWPHRLATAFLVGLPLASWLSYLLALALGRIEGRLLIADAVVAWGLVLVALWFWRRRRVTPAAPVEGDRADRWDLLTIAGIALLVGWMMASTYHVTDGRLGIASGLWSDFGPTSAIAQSFAVGDNFPTEYPHYAGEPIRYHFLYYFQVGNLTHLGLDPATANNVLSIGSLVAMLVLVMALGRRLFGSALVGRLGAALFFVHGALSFIPYLLGLGSVTRALDELPRLTAFMDSGFPWRGEEWGIWTQMVFLNQRHLASAIGMLLVIVLFLLERLPDRRAALAAHPAGRVEPVATADAATAAAGRTREAAVEPDPAPLSEPAPLPEPEPSTTARRRLAWFRDDLPRPGHPLRLVRDTVRDPALPGFVLCGALAGMLPLWNGSMFVAAAALLAIWLVLFPNRPQMLVLAVAAAVLALPQLAWVRPGTMAGAQTYPSFHWGYVIDDPTIPNVASYLAFVFGPKLLLVAVALVAASWRQWRVFIAFSGLVAVAFLMQLSVEVLANHKFINAWLIVANLFAAAGLLRLWRSRPVLRIPARAAAVGLAAVIVVGGVIDLLPVKNQGILEFGMEGDPLYEWVLAETDPHDVFLTELVVVHPILLAGRGIYYGWPYYAWSAGYDVFPREARYRGFFGERSARALAEQLREASIDYVAIDDGLRRQAFVPKLNEDVFEQHFERVFTDDGSHGNIAIYRVPTDAAAVAALPEAPPHSLYEAGTGTDPGVLAAPRGIAVEPRGTVLVADTGNDRIQRFSTAGTAIDVIGGPGSDPGRFEDPVAVAVDGGGRLYVADAGNLRVQQLDADGAFLQAWTGPPDGFGTLADLDTDGDTVYALDGARGRVVRIAPDGTVSSWGSTGSGPGQLVAPTGLAAVAGRVYVADPGRAAVVVFAADGTQLELFAVPEWTGDTSGLADVEADADGTTWVTVPATNSVVVFDAARAVTRPLVAEPEGPFDGPTGLVLRPGGSLFVVNRDGNRVSLISQVRP